jgi:hypothetical protein
MDSVCGGRLTKTALTTSRLVIFAASSNFQLLNQLLHAVAQASQIALISLSWSSESVKMTCTKFH